MEFIKKAQKIYKKHSGSVSDNIPELMNFKLECEKYIQEKPFDVDAQVDYALIDFFMWGTPQSTISILEDIIKIDPDSIKAILILSALKSVWGDGIDELLFQKINNLKPKDQESRSLVEVAKYWHYRKISDAENIDFCLEKAVTYGPDNMYAYSKIVDIHLKKNEKKQACAVLNTMHMTMGKILNKHSYHGAIPSYNNFIDTYYKAIYPPQAILNQIETDIKEKCL